GDREVVEREPFGALEQERLARLRLERVQHARAVARELGRDARVDLHEERFDVGVLARHVAQLALEVDRDRLLRADHALAVAGGTGAAHDLAHPLGDVLARHLDKPELGDLGGEGLRAVLVERLAQHLHHRIAIARAGHVDEVDHDDPADVAQAQLVDDLLGGLEVGLRDRVLQARALAAADERARVDVYHGQRLGVIDDQVAPARQIDAAREQAFDRLVDAVGLEQRLLLLPQLDALDELGGRAGEERDQTVVLLLVVYDRALEVRREDVTHDAHGQVGLLKDQIRGGRVLDALDQHLVQLVQVLQLAFEILALGAVRG